jgi:hypothetical protein
MGEYKLYIYVEHYGGWSWTFGGAFLLPTIGLILSANYHQIYLSLRLGTVFIQGSKSIIQLEEESFYATFLERYAGERL